MTLSRSRGCVNPFSARIIGYQGTPDSPNTEAIVDLEILGLLHLKQVRISRNRVGHVMTRLPNTLGPRAGKRGIIPAVWLPTLALKSSFDEAVESALHEFVSTNGGAL
jgi:hypothetical protein